MSLVPLVFSSDTAYNDGLEEPAEEAVVEAAMFFFEIVCCQAIFLKFDVFQNELN